MSFRALLLEINLLLSLVLGFLIVIRNAEPLWCGKPYNISASQSSQFLVLPSLVPFTSEEKGYLLSKMSEPYWHRSFLFNASDLKRHTVVVAMTEFTVSPEKNLFPFDLNVFPMKNTTEILCVVSSLDGNELIAETRVNISRFPPKPNEVKIDHWNSGLIADGLPFFPFGFYHYYKNPKEIFREISGELMSGLTTILPYENGLPTEEYLHVMDFAYASGLK